MYGHAPSLHITAISAALPAHVEHNSTLDWLSPDHRAEIIQYLGITKRHIVQDQTMLELATAACQQLRQTQPDAFEQLGLCLLITQTSPWKIPSAAFYLHDTLKLHEDCVCLELNLGCSGYVYGLWLAAHLLATMPNKYALIVAGDVSSMHLKPQDSSTIPLFSDAVSASLVRRSEPADTMPYYIANAGKEHQVIALRNDPPDTQKYLHMDGMQVLSLAIQQVVPSVQQLMQKAKLSAAAVDYFVFHQASKLINESIRTRLSIPLEKYPYSLQHWGNTSSATLPMTLMTLEPLRHKPHQILLCGFGVGMSWGSVVLNNPPIAINEPILI